MDLEKDKIIRMQKEATRKLEMQKAKEDFQKEQSKYGVTRNECYTCKYYGKNPHEPNTYKKNCNYLIDTGHSRIVKEREAGTYLNNKKKCICYEKGNRSGAKTLY